MREPHSRRYILTTIVACYSSSTLLTIFGGRVDDLKVILKEERLPDGWESRIRAPFGLTLGAFNRTVLRVELGIDESTPLKKEELSG